MGGGFACLPACALSRGRPEPRPATLLRHPVGDSGSWWYRNIDLLCIGYAWRPRLSSRLTQGGRTYPWKPWIFGHYDSHAILATHSGILTSVKSTPAYADASPRYRTLPYPVLDCLSFGYMLSPVKSSAQHHSTSELLRTLLMSGCF